MAKLQDLKLWQGNYEALLQNKSSEINNPSDFDTIEGLSALDSTRSTADMSVDNLENRQNVDWDKKVVTPCKPFEQLLEEKLAQDEPVVCPVKPKKPFLRKGAGLTRYRMTYPQTHKRARTVQKNPSSTKSSIVENLSTSKAKISPRHKNCFKSTVTTSTENCSGNLVPTPLTVPAMGIKPKGIWVKVQQNDKEGTQPFSKSYYGMEEHKDRHGNLMGRISEFALRHLLPNSPKKNGYINNTQEKP